MPMPVFYQHSQILGFLNVFLFACNVWFVYKETEHFKLRQQQQLQQQQPYVASQQQDIPPQQLPQQY